MNARFLAYALLISGFITSNAAYCLAEEPGVTRCSENACEWSLIKKKRTVSKENDVNLIEAEIVRGYSLHKTGYVQVVEQNKDSYKKIRIKWNKGEPEGVTVFCYGRLPVYGTDGKWFVLPFDSPYPAFHQAMSDFVHICYDAQRNAWQDGAFLEKNHLTMPLVTQVSIQDPKELFKYIK
jgi:hypothetical protein